MKSDEEDHALAEMRKAEEYSTKVLRSPYPEVLAFIDKHSYSSTAHRLAKFILSLYDSQQSFSLSECVASNDYQVNELVCRCVDYFLRKGETEDLRIIGRAVIVRYPWYHRLGQAGWDAKKELENAPPADYQDPLPVDGPTSFD